MNKYQFQLLTSTGLGHEYFYCYGRDDFEKWLRRKNIKYKIDKRSINIFDEKDKEIERLKDTLKDREDYIGHLEELCNKYEEENKMYADLKDDYENRINDAIQYLASCDWNDKHYAKLYDILMGDE